MKVIIEVSEIPLVPIVDEVGAKPTRKQEFNKEHTVLDLHRAPSTLVIYTADWGTHYEVRINTKGRAYLKEVGHEECMR